jgi:hypothetical protein
MRKKIPIYFFLVLIVVLLLVSVEQVRSAPEGFLNDWRVIGGGAGPTMSGGGYVLDSTLGQTAIGESTGSVSLGSGYWFSETSGHKIVLPIVLQGSVP